MSQDDYLETIVNPGDRQVGHKPSPADSVPPPGTVRPVLVLLGVSGAVNGQRFRIVGEEAVLGRHPDSPVAIDRAVGSLVSSRHARVRFERGSWWIEDLGSRNGTSLDGRPLTRRRRLDSGARVCLGPPGRSGSAEFFVEDGAGPSAPIATERRAGGALHPGRLLARAREGYHRFTERRRAAAELKELEGRGRALARSLDDALLALARTALPSCRDLDLEALEDVRNAEDQLREIEAQIEAAQSGLAALERGTATRRAEHEQARAALGEALRASQAATREAERALSDANGRLADCVADRFDLLDRWSARLSEFAVAERDAISDDLPERFAGLAAELRSLPDAIASEPHDFEVRRADRREARAALERARADEDAAMRSLEAEQQAFAQHERDAAEERARLEEIGSRAATERERARRRLAQSQIALGRELLDLGRIERGWRDACKAAFLARDEYETWKRRVDELRGRLTGTDPREE